MQFDNYILPAIIFLFMVLLTTKLKILPETQRLALFKLGIFRKFLGPGLVFQLANGVHRWIRVTVGETGELIAPDVGRFLAKKNAAYDIPVVITDSAAVGSILRITGFTEDKARCMMNSDQRKSIRCEKCGHEMSVN